MCAHIVKPCSVIVLLLPVNLCCWRWHILFLFASLYRHKTIATKCDVIVIAILWMCLFLRCDCEEDKQTKYAGRNVRCPFSYCENRANNKNINRKQNIYGARAHSTNFNFILLFCREFIFPSTCSVCFFLFQSHSLCKHNVLPCRCTVVRFQYNSGVKVTRFVCSKLQSKFAENPFKLCMF